MISKVLQEKRKNLLELNKNSPELFLAKGFINILKFVDQETLTNFIQDPNAFELKIDCNQILNSTISALQGCQNNLELDAKIKELKIDYDTSKLDLQNGTSSQRETIINNIGKSILAEFKQIHKMSKDAADEFYDSGKWCMYICAGVLETSIGELLSTDKINLRAPLLALAVAVKKVSETSYLLYKKERTFYANEILNIYLKDKLNIKYIEQAELDTINPINSYLTLIASRIPNATLEPTITALQEVKKTGYKPFDLPVIHNCLCLAFINPVGGKMLEDYDTIISSDYDFPQENLMFTNQGLDKLVYDADKVMELTRLLNISQKKAVIASLKTNTLIYGPPGTGKSEVVTSIIANNVKEGFNVLISSEKKAALDVINDRLDVLKDITITIDQDDIDTFYDKIIALNDEIINASIIHIDETKPQYTNLVGYMNNILKANSSEQKAKALQSLVDQSKSTYKVDKDILEQMLNKIKLSGLTAQEFVDKLYQFHDVAKVINKYYPINSLMVPIFNKDNAIRLLEILRNTSGQNRQFYVIDNYIKENRPKAGLFCGQINEQQVTQLNELVDVFAKIANGNKLIFFINYLDWLNTLVNITKEDLVKQLNVGVIQESKDVGEVFADIKQGKLLYSYLDEYWAANLAKATISGKLIKDKYLFELKKKFMADPSIQAKWIEMVKKAHLPTKINVAKFIKEYYSVLKFAFPIWILSPDNVANYIPLQNHEFAVGIFDEASQMRVERSLPLIYRCTRNVVSGDDKQLRPSRFFASAVKFDPDDLTSQEELDNVESLLDKAKIANWSSFVLNNHYRSNCEELIGFSNKYIYEDKLICITKHGCNNTKPIEVVQMPSTTIYDRSTNTNPDEAKKVVEIVKANEKYKKIVIITFNQKQADLIENLCYQYPFLTSRLEADTMRIRSIENVQGDEADLVVISTTFGTDANGKFIQNFGPVGQAGGKNRINVMVTRAKEKMIIVKSFSSDAITSTNNENLYILKMFLAYIENLQDNKNIIVGEKANSHGKAISQAIASEIKSSTGYDIQTNYAIGSHNFDLAIIANNEPKLLVLIDDANDLKQVDITKWIDSFDVQKYYGDRGYKILRFNEYEWLSDKTQIINKLVQMAQ